MRGMRGMRGRWRETTAGVTVLTLVMGMGGAGPLLAASAVGRTGQTSAGQSSGGQTGVAPGARPASTVQSPIAIAHDPLRCVNTDYAPKVDAAVAPSQIYEKGYVYFKAAGTEDYYYTPMAGTPESLAGVLPRPLPETRAVDYFVQATDVQDLAKKTDEYVPPVVPGNACKVKGEPAGVKVGKEGAGLTIGLTREGQNPAPPGFNRRDIAFVILFGGATVSLAQALKGSGSGGSTTSSTSTTTGGTGTTSKSSGGLSTGAAIGIGAVVVAGAALIIANNNKSNNAATATPTPTQTATPTRTPTATVALRFIDAAVTWSGVGNVDVEIRDPNNQSVGTRIPVGCESTSSRTEHVLLQGVLAPGTYRVMLTADNCGSTGAPSAIVTAVSVQSDTGPKCVNAFVSVPLTTTVQGCTFTLP